METSNKNLSIAALNLVDESYSFQFEEFLKVELKIKLTKPKALQGQLCKFFAKGFCIKGEACHLRHTLTHRNKYILQLGEKTERSVVCKHWLRGLCKKGELCEFLHEYNMKKMPECWFYQKYAECSNPECMYKHLDPDSKVNECDWYARGFCKHGALCRNKHTRKAACQNYLTGFCPNGEECQYGQYFLINLVRNMSYQICILLIMKINKLIKHLDLDNINH